MIIISTEIALELGIPIFRQTHVSMWRFLKLGIPKLPWDSILKCSDLDDLGTMTWELPWISLQSTALFKHQDAFRHRWPPPQRKSLASELHLGRSPLHLTATMGLGAQNAGCYGVRNGFTMCIF